MRTFKAKGTIDGVWREIMGCIGGTCNGVSRQGWIWSWFLIENEYSTKSKLIILTSKRKSDIISLQKYKKGAKVKINGNLHSQIKWNNNILSTSLVFQK